MGYSLRSVAPTEGQAIWGTQTHSLDKQWYKRVTNPITVGYYLLLCQLPWCVKALQPLSFHSLLDSLIRQACNVGVPEVCHCWSAPAKQSQLLPEYQSFCADKNAELLILHEAFHVYGHRRAGAHSQQVTYWMKASCVTRQRDESSDEQWRHTAYPVWAVTSMSSKADHIDTSRETGMHTSHLNNFFYLVV